MRNRNLAAPLVLALVSAWLWPTSALAEPRVLSFANSSGGYALAWETNCLGAVSPNGSVLSFVGLASGVCAPLDVGNDECTFYATGMVSGGTNQGVTQYLGGTVKIYRDPSMNAPDASGAEATPPGAGVVPNAFINGSLILQGTVLGAQRSPCNPPNCYNFVILIEITGGSAAGALAGMPYLIIQSTWYDTFANGYCFTASGEFQSLLSPSVSVTPSCGPRGTIFSEPGQSFTPYSQVELHFFRPDGTPDLPNIVKMTDECGQYFHQYDSTPKTIFGTYSYYAVDVATGRQSATRTFDILSSSPVTLAGRVEGEVVDLPSRIPVPTRSPLAGSRVGLIRGGQALTPLAEADAAGDFSMNRTVLCGDFLADSLTNSILDVETPAGPQGRRTSGVPTAQTNFAWPLSHATNAYFLSEKVARDYWQTRLGVPIVRKYVVLVDMTTAPEGGGAQTLSGTGQPVTRYWGDKPMYGVAVYHEFGHRMIIEKLGSFIAQDMPEQPPPAGTDEALGMDEGLADFFTAAYTGDPVIAVDGIRRNLDQATHVSLYDFYDGVYRDDNLGYKGALIFGGALWDAWAALTSEADRITFEKAVYEAVGELAPFAAWSRSFFLFRQKLLARNELQGTHFRSAIEAGFDRHNIRQDPTANCRFRPRILSQTNGVDEAGQHVSIDWSPTPDAAWYRVYLRSSSEGLGIGPGTLVADSLQETRFQYDEPDTSLSLGFLVASVDPSANDIAASDEARPTASVALHPPASGPRLWAGPSPARTGVTWNAEGVAGSMGRVVVYDVTGRMVRVLWRGRIDGSSMRGTWDARTSTGVPVTAGVYLMAIEAADKRAVARIAVVR